jgi:hypothetical protein
VVVGWAEKMPESRKNPKPDKCLSKPQNPHHPLHALLGAVELENSLAIDLKKKNLNFAL